MKPNTPETRASLRVLPARPAFAPVKTGAFLFDVPLRLFDASVIEDGDKVMACADDEREDRIVQVYRSAA